MSSDDRGLSDQLAGMVRSYLDDSEIGLTPDDLAHEVHANTWSYAVEGAVDVDAVVESLAFVASRLRAHLSGHDGAATFYVWYDQQAGQLRCGLDSVTPDRLPFGGRYRVVEDVRDVVTRAAADTHPGVVLREDLTELITPAADSHESAPEPFPVWASPM